MDSRKIFPTTVSLLYWLCLGYFVYFIWKTIQGVINPVVKDQHVALIKPTISKNV